MKRYQTATKVGENKMRYRTRIEDEPSPEGSQEARIRAHTFMRQLVENWALLNCGLEVPQEVKLYHTGNNWVVEAEAIVDEIPNE